MKEKLDLLLAVITVAVAIIVLITQLSANRKAQAEVTFFGLLSAIRNLVTNTEGQIKQLENDVYSDPRPKFKRGTEYFYEANQELQMRLKKMIGNAALDGQIKPKGDETRKRLNEMAIKTYNTFFDEHHAELSHYFRFTFNVVNFIDKHQDIDSDKKAKYINFIQSQMSESELQLLFYNGIGKHGAKYHKLIERYNFLQNISTENYVAFFEDLYPKSEFR